MNRWQKILLGVAAGLAGLATFIPGAAIVTLPVLGAIKAATVVQAVAAFAAGVAVKTPGHVPAGTDAKAN